MDGRRPVKGADSGGQNQPGGNDDSADSTDSTGNVEINVELLCKIMSEYAGVDVRLTPFEDEATGASYTQYLMMKMDYLTY